MIRPEGGAVNYSPSGVRQYMEDRGHDMSEYVEGPPKCPICGSWNVGLDKWGGVDWCEDHGTITYHPDTGEPSGEET